MPGYSILPTMAEIRVGLLGLFGGFDLWYNMDALTGKGGLKREAVSDEITVSRPYFPRTFNSAARLPVLLAGLASITKFGSDIVNYAFNGQPYDPNSPCYVAYGVGLLSLASSMYIKEAEPKLLDREPNIKRLANFIGRIQAKYLQPTPQPAQVPVIN